MRRPQQLATLHWHAYSAWHKCQVGHCLLLLWQGMGLNPEGLVLWQGLVYGVNTLKAAAVAGRTDWSSHQPAVLVGGWLAIQISHPIHSFCGGR